MNREDFDMRRAQAVLDFCRQPRTMREIRQHFADDSERARFAVYNLIRRGELVNLGQAEGRAMRKPGLFVASGVQVPAEAVAEKLPEPSKPQRKAQPAPRPRGPGADLAAAWGIGRRAS